MEIPKYTEALDRKIKGEETALESFIVDWEPGLGDKAEQEWRLDLVEVCKEAFEHGMTKGRMEEARDALNSQVESNRRILLWSRLLIISGSIAFLLTGLGLLITVVAFAWKIILS